MKFYFAMAALLFARTLTAEVSVEIRPSSPVAGRMFHIVLSSPDGKPSFRDFPKVSGLKRTGSSGQEIRSINFKTTYAVTEGMVADKPGTYTLPPFRVKVGSRTELTSALSFEVLPAENAESGEASRNPADKVSGVFRAEDPHRTYYTGEEISLWTEFWIPEGTRVSEMTYPQVNIPGAVFRNFGSVNPENPLFERPQTRIVRQNSRRYRVSSMRLAFRPTRPGKIVPEAVSSVVLQIPEDDDDDFWGRGFFSRYQAVRQNVTFQSPGPLTVLPLPEAPGDAFFTGIVGNCDAGFELDGTQNCRVGGMLTLKLCLRNAGGGELFKVPEISLPGFRVYPPEILKQNNTVTASWQLVPLRSGKTPFQLKISVFNSEKGQYRITEFSRELAVAPAERTIENAPLPAAGKIPLPSVQSPPPPLASQTGLLYLKPAPGRTAVFPLWKNRLGWCILLLVAGPALWGSAEIFVRRRARLENSEALRRQTRARKESRAVLKALQNARDDAEFNRILSQEVLPLLADTFHLAPGCTLEDTANCVKSQVLADALREAGARAYLPENAPRPPVNKAPVLRALKKLWILLPLLLFFAAGLQGEDHFRLANGFYDRGAWQEALQEYRQCLRQGVSSPLLYNAGCAEFMLGNTAEAMADFEAARRLDPADSAPLENLNAARLKLGLAPEGTLETPGKLLIFLRDKVRPDGWILAACLAWFASFAWTARQRLKGLPFPRKIPAAGLILAFFSVFAAWSQFQSVYRTDRAVVLDGGAELRQLPSPAGKIQRTLSAGQEVVWAEKRGGFVLVRLKSAQGWISQDRLRRIFPAGK